MSYFHFNPEFHLRSNFKLLFFLLISNIAFFAHAQKQTSIEFSDAEIRRHLKNSDLIARESANCIENVKKSHEQFYAQFGFSKYFGNRIKPSPSVSQRMTLIRNANYVNQSIVQSLSPSQLQQAVEQMESTACITMAVRCIGQGFQTAGDQDTWKKIYDYLGREGNWYGHELQQALMDLGWKSLYWNPDPSKNSEWDQEDRRLNPLKPGKKWNPVWGAHQSIFQQVMRKKTYGYTSLRVDDDVTLVDFKQNVPQSFKNIPFFIGIAHQGYHVFPGTFGHVVEAHSTRPVGRKDNIEFAPFNPLAGAKPIEQGGGSPRWSNLERYRSGLIVVPPNSGL